MGYRVSGILKLPDGAPANNAEIEFISRKNFSPLVQELKSNIKCSATGAYDVTLEYGEYAVVVYPGGTYPAALGTIILAVNTVAGQDLPTLLQQAGWQPATPEYIQQIAQWLAEVNASASAAKVSEFNAAASASAVNGAIVAHEGKPSAHNISGVSGLQSELDKRVLTSGGTISNLRRAGQEHGSLISNVAHPLPNNGETTVHNCFAVILLNGWSDTMVRFRLVIRDYANKHRNVDITFSGYLDSGSNNWVAEASEASAVGTGALDWRVFTHKDSDGLPIIYFYNPNGFDDHSTVEIVDDVSRGAPPSYGVGRVQGYDGTPVTVSRHYHTGNVVGPVNLSAGVPSGAIIERGANANGEYVKFADGTMLCWLSNLNIPITPLSAGFSSACHLPALFASVAGMKPVASILSTNSGNVEPAGALYRNGFVLNVTNTSQIDLSGYTYVSPIQSPLTIGIQVSGRWA